jgi:hypothetical protein
MKENKENCRYRFQRTKQLFHARMQSASSHYHMQLLQVGRLLLKNCSEFQ